MGKRGFQASPKREKQLLGINKKSRLKEDGIDRIDGELIKFESNDIDEIEKMIRDVHEQMLKNTGFIGVTDSLIFKKFCKAAADWFKFIEENKNKSKYIEKTEANGNINYYIAPWHKIEMDLSQQLERLIKELGLTPASRDNVKKIAQKKKINKWSLK